MNSESFKCKINITGKTPASGNTKDVKIAVPLKYLNNFWGTPEMPSINCEINLILTLSENCYFYAITDTKLYVQIVTLSTQDSAKLLEQLRSGFKRTVVKSKVSTISQNQYLDFSIDPSFKGVNRLFVLLFENEAHRKAHAKYYLPKVEIKNYNVIIDGKTFFDQPIKRNMRT